MLSDEIIKNMIADYYSGKTIASIAIKYQFGFNQTYAALNRGGCVFRSKGRYTPDMDERGKKIYQMLKKGLTRDEICKRLNIKPCLYYSSCYREDNIRQLLNITYKKPKANPRVPNNQHTVDDIELTKDGKVISKLNKTPIKVYHVGGYHLVKLKKTHHLHVLLAEKYIGRKNRWDVVVHKDGDPNNNSIENLEFISRSELASKYWNRVK